MDLYLREIKPCEYLLLDDFLYEAIFQPDEDNILPKDIIKEPCLQVYIKDFGKVGDECLVAVVEDEVIGGVWTRFIKSFGYVADDIVELSISLYKDFRGKGVGTKLMLSMIDLLKRKGYRGVSLSVQKANPASNLYKRLNFEIVRETKEDYLMMLALRS